VPALGVLFCSIGLFPRLTGADWLWRDRVSTLLSLCSGENPQVCKISPIQGFQFFCRTTGVVFYLCLVFFRSECPPLFLAVGLDASGGFIGIIARFILQECLLLGTSPRFILLHLLFHSRQKHLSKIMTNPSKRFGLRNFYFTSFKVH
jgi:hypothetical protein